MADPDLLPLTKTNGASGIAKWRHKHPNDRPDLSEANLIEADLRKADLTGADLREAELFEADLSGGHLTRADLTGADLTRANLTGADLTGADLTRATLGGADLGGADLGGADLGGTLNLELARNLDQARSDDQTRWPEGFTPPETPNPNPEPEGDPLEAAPLAPIKRREFRDDPTTTTILMEVADRSAGILNELIGGLFFERDKLEEQLTWALNDLDAARRTIQVLEAQLDALHVAQSTGDPRTRKTLYSVAAGALVPLLMFVSGGVAAAVTGQYGIEQAEINSHSANEVASAEAQAAIRVARIAAGAEVEAAQIATECSTQP